jgi:hypothetical protein
MRRLTFWYATVNGLCLLIYVLGSLRLLHSIALDGLDDGDVSVAISYGLTVLPFAVIAVAYDIGLGVWAVMRRGVSTAKLASLLSIAGVVTWAAVWVVIRGLGA